MSTAEPLNNKSKTVIAHAHTHTHTHTHNKQINQSTRWWTKH